MNRTIRTRDGALELSDEGLSPSLLSRSPTERCALDLSRDELRALRWAIDELLYGPPRCVPLLASSSANRAN